MTTPNMSLDLPVPSTTPGPTWATKVNVAFDEVDAHDHSSGNGARVTPAGLNIIADLLFNNNSATGLKTARLQDQGAVPSNASDIGCVVNVNGDLWWRNAAGTGVQITSGGGINIASVGTIGGDYGQPGITASVNYSDLLKTFVFLRGSGETAELLVGDLSIQNKASGSQSVTIKASNATVAYALTLPVISPAADTVLSFDVTGQATFRTITGTSGEVTVSSAAATHQVSLPSTITKALTFSGANTYSGTATHSGAATFSNNVAFTGSTSGRGILPLGAVIATMPHLVGAYSCSATTVADANGFVQCAGQTIADATSPMNGTVIPNINDDAFLRGNATSGTAAGSNANITLATTNLPSHVHNMDHGHANTFGLTGTTTFAANSHTHDMAHVHQMSHHPNGTTNYWAPREPVSAQLSWTTSGTSIEQMLLDVLLNSGGTGTFTQVASYNAQPRTWYTGGAINNSSTAAQSGGNSSSASVGFAGAVTNMTGNTGGTGSGTSFSVLPKYISARFVMRVK